MTLLWVLQQEPLLSVLELTRRVVRFVYERTGLVAWKLYGRVIVRLDGHSRRLAQGFSRNREAIGLGQPTEMCRHSRVAQVISPSEGFSPWSQGSKRKNRKKTEGGDIVAAIGTVRAIVRAVERRLRKRGSGGRDHLAPLPLEIDNW